MNVEVQEMLDLAVNMDEAGFCKQIIINLPGNEMREKLAKLSVKYSASNVALYLYLTGEKFLFDDVYNPKCTPGFAALMVGIVESDRAAHFDYLKKALNAGFDVFKTYFSHAYDRHLYEEHANCKKILNSGNVARLAFLIHQGYNDFDEIGKIIEFYDQDENLNVLFKLVQFL